MKTTAMTPELKRRLLEEIEKITFDENGEPSKGLTVFVGELPVYDVVSVVVNEDNIELQVKRFQ